MLQQTQATLALENAKRELQKETMELQKKQTDLKQFEVKREELRREVEQKEAELRETKTSIDRLRSEANRIKHRPKHASLPTKDASGKVSVSSDHSLNDELHEKEQEVRKAELDSQKLKTEITAIRNKILQNDRLEKNAEFELETVRRNHEKINREISDLLRDHQNAIKNTNK